jgi:SepF-like predicted cell division protein (DUF552 family)
MRMVNRISKNIAAVTEDFKEKCVRLKDTLVFKSPAFKKGKKFLSMFVVKDPQDPKDPGYYYVERLGMDSIAFLLHDSNEEDKPYIVLEQYHSPRRIFQKGAFTGSMDKDGLTPEDTTIEEILEEAGYTITKDNLHKVGLQTVGANTNEEVHLFIADITGLQRKKKESENIWEENTNLIKMSKDEILKNCEWRAILCMIKWECLKVFPEGED